MKTLRQLHRWLGLLVFIQLLLWIGSGLLISLLDADVARGRTTRADIATSPLVTEALLPVSALPRPFAGVESIRLQTVADTLVYRVAGRDSSRLYDAVTGEPVVIDEARAMAIARQSYRPLPGEREITPVAAYFEETVWRVAFDDPVETMVFVGVDDGHVLGHRNNRTELVEFLLMLHFMDYNGGHDFNHPLIIIAAVLAAWLSLSGALLLVGSIRRVGLR